MGKDLIAFEPIMFPGQRRPGILPSLPRWVERLNGAVRVELQMNLGDGTFEEQEVLPPDMVPTEEQRRAMIDHSDGLRSTLRETPAVGIFAETRVATAVSKLLSVLPGERKSDLEEEVRSDTYLEVLDDVPWWAVDAAVSAWFRHDCGSNERGQPHDYKWAPDPGMLRNIALTHTYPIIARIRTMQRLLEARKYVDCTKQLAAGRAALDGLNKAMAAGDLNAVQALTFRRAVKLGSAMEPPT